MKKYKWHVRPSKSETPGYVRQKIDTDILGYIFAYGALTLPMLYWLLNGKSLPHYKERSKKEAAEYLFLAKHLNRLWKAKEIERSTGLHAITYGLKKIGQNHHWLDRSRSQMTIEFFHRQHPEYLFEWKNEEGRRSRPGNPDAFWYEARPQSKQIQEYWFRWETDRGTESIPRVKDKLLAHLAARDEMETKRGTPEYQPFRVLFSTNNKDNMLSRIRRHMALVPESMQHPRFILYTDHARALVPFDVRLRTSNFAGRHGYVKSCSSSEYHPCRSGGDDDDLDPHAMPLL